MRLFLRLALPFVLVLLLFVGRWLWLASGVGAGYAAKVTCSLAFNSGQNAERVVREYVALEVAPLGAALDVARTEHGAEARVLGMLRARAVHRPGLGCTLLAGSEEAELEPPGGLALARPRLDPGRSWPLGGAGPAAPAAPELEAAIARAFDEPALPPGRVRATKAVVVVHDGRLVAERYAPGYGPETPLISWSMAKSVIATLVGIAAAEGRLDLHAPAPVPEWADPDDPRHAITLDQLLRQSSGLRFDEDYGNPISDVSRMLFTRPDTGAFAARFPLVASPDARWSYSSGTSNIVARALRDAFGGDFESLVRWANARLFDPAGMTSAFFEPDAAGTPIGSSFHFANARDWARFGELHRRDGVWFGRRLLPRGWVGYVTTPTPAAPQRQYGAHWWLYAGDPAHPASRRRPGIPADAYAARGHSGQYVVVVPSAKLVVVRLGLSVGLEENEGASELVETLVQIFAKQNGETGEPPGTGAAPVP